MDNVSIRVVSQHDPAVDWKKTDKAEYRKTCDAGRVVAIEGRKPVWFTIRELSLQDMIEIHSLPTSATQGARAFRLCIEAVEGAPGLTPDGTAWRPAHEEQRGSGELVKVPSWPDMEAVFRHVGFVRMLDIGGLAIERASVLGNGAGGAG